MEEKYLLEQGETSVESIIQDNADPVRLTNFAIIYGINYGQFKDVINQCDQT